MSWRISITLVRDPAKARIEPKHDQPRVAAGGVAADQLPRRTMRSSTNSAIGLRSVHAVLGEPRYPVPRLLIFRWSSTFLVRPLEAWPVFRLSLHDPQWHYLILIVGSQGCVFVQRYKNSSENIRFLEEEAIIRFAQTRLRRAILVLSSQTTSSHLGIEGGWGYCAEK